MFLAILFCLISKTHLGLPFAMHLVSSTWKMSDYGAEIRDLLYADYMTPHEFRPKLQVHGTDLVKLYGTLGFSLYRTHFAFM